MLATEFVDLEERYGAHNYQPLDVVLEHGDGVWVWDVYGRRYLDCLAGYSAVSQGHCHPRIVEAAITQARRLTLTSRAFRNDQFPLLCEQLHELTGMEMALLMSSGAEAVETAIKAARKWGYSISSCTKDLSIARRMDRTVRSPALRHASMKADLRRARPNRKRANQY